jgi:hypothetical protein
MVSLVCPCCPWLVLALEVFQLCTNHLVWVLCRPVWVREACEFFLVPSRSSSMPLYPSKCCQPGSVLQLFPFPLFYIWTHIWVPQGVGSALFRERLQGSKHLALGSFLYHWKYIEVWMFKMGSYDPFGHLQHKLWQEKKGLKSNC